MDLGSLLRELTVSSNLFISFFVTNLLLKRITENAQGKIGLWQGNCLQTILYISFKNIFLKVIYIKKSP